MGSGFSKMKKQAKMMEQQFETMRNELKNKFVTGVSGNGLVTITLNGDKELQTILIKPDCVDPTDIEGLQDLIKAAHYNACSQLEDSEMQLPF